mmetsp:Transcript_52214/g.167350  ORF Transcript_52214/g.167350 Transcript_52214/m.167350 type:complete len:213 (+) Transcript_52214:1111-1749(+)
MCRVVLRVEQALANEGAAKRRLSCGPRLLKQREGSTDALAHGPQDIDVCLYFAVQQPQRVWGQGVWRSISQRRPIWLAEMCHSHIFQNCAIRNKFQLETLITVTPEKSGCEAAIAMRLHPHSHLATRARDPRELRQVQIRYVLLLNTFCAGVLNSDGILKVVPVQRRAHTHDLSKIEFQLPKPPPVLLITPIRIFEDMRVVDVYHHMLPIWV